MILKTNIIYLSKNLQEVKSSMHYLTNWDETTDEPLNDYEKNAFSNICSQ